MHDKLFPLSVAIRGERGSYNRALHNKHLPNECSYPG